MLVKVDFMMKKESFLTVFNVPSSVKLVKILNNALVVMKSKIENLMSFLWIVFVNSDLKKILIVVYVGNVIYFRMIVCFCAL